MINFNWNVEFSVLRLIRATVRSMDAYKNPLTCTTLASKHESQKKEDTQADTDTDNTHAHTHTYTHKQVNKLAIDAAI